MTIMGLFEEMGGIFRPDPIGSKTVGALRIEFNKKYTKGQIEKSVDLTALDLFFQHKTDSGKWHEIPDYTGTFGELLKKYL